MARRLALAILLIVWATLIAGGLVAYFATRWALLADLDAALIRRARAIPELSGHPQAQRLQDSTGDRYLITGPLGQTIGRSIAPTAAAPPPALLRAALVTLGDKSHVRTLTLGFSTQLGGPPTIVVYSGSAGQFDRVLRRLALALFGFGGAAGIAAAGVAVLVSRRALRPLRDTARAIGEINEKKLDRRIDAADLPPELQPVAERLNQMLARLERAFDQRKQFLADASHELRTPVAALVTTLEVALRRPRDAVELTRSLRACLADSRMLQQLVQTLLEHARGENPAAMACQRFDAAQLLSDCADVVDGLAMQKNVTILRTYPAPIFIESDPRLLRGIVMNLLGNAVEYNRPGGTVALAAEACEQALVLTVSDDGPGIAADQLPHIFQPFFRGVSPSAADGEGATPPHLGLGLFLVDAHVRTLGGQCAVHSQIGAGTTFVVRLKGVMSETAAARHPPAPVANAKVSLSFHQTTDKVEHT